MQDPEELCRALMVADDEEVVVDILEEAGLWSDERFWRYYGDDELNWNRAGNQQARSDFALNEKLVNTVDSRLMLECMLQGIAPASPNAPKSIREGVSRLIEKSAAANLKVTGGRIEDWPPEYRTRVAKDQVVFITGNSSSYSISVADLGEGQTPEAFPQSLLSLGKNNKIRVSFVQGKFGQGSTGALRFCGERKLQLIVSKRHPELIGNPVVSPDYPVHETDNCWGFTVVRREGKGMDVRSPFYSYLAPVCAEENERNGKVLCFQSASLPIFPEGDKAFVRGAAHGTLVKLFNYKLKNSRHILRKDGLRGRVDLLLPEPALPLSFHECRPNMRSQRTHAETMSGLFARLGGDGALNDLEEIKPEMIAINVAGLDLHARIFAFKPGKSSAYRKSEGVIFSINGQTQGYVKASFFSRPRLGLQKLAKDLLVVLDCSAFSAIEQDDLFMPSRDRLVEDNELAGDIETKLEKVLKDHPGLKQLKNQRATLDAEEKLADNKPLEETLDRVLKSSPILSRIFTKGMRLPNAKRPDNVQPANDPFRGKPHPSYFRFVGREQDFKLLRTVHLGRQTRIAFETDVEDSYFNRRDYPGKLEVFKVEEDGCQTLLTNYVHYLSDGRCNISLDLPKETVTGDVLNLLFVVSDQVIGTEFKNSSKLTVLAEAQVQPGSSTKRKNPGNSSEGNVKGSTGIDMPEVRWVDKSKSNWESYFSSADDCLCLIHEECKLNGKTEMHYEFLINESNKALQMELRESKLARSIVKKQFEVGVVLIGLAMIHDERQRGHDRRHADYDSAEEVSTLRDRAAAFTRAIGPVILPMIQSLGNLTEDEIDLSDLAGEVA